MRHFLDFEKSIAELEGKIEELRHLADGQDINIADEVGKLQTQADRMLRQTYEKLTPWQRVQVAPPPQSTPRVGLYRCPDHRFYAAGR